MPILVLAIVAFVLYRYLNRGRTRPDSPEIGAVAWTADTKWAVVPPLGLFEARRLATHPAFLVGIVVSPLMLMLATTDLSATEGWRDAGPSIALALVPLGWLVVAATHLLATKPARAGVDMLFASLPAPRPARTAAALTSAGVAALAAAALAAGWSVWISNRGDGIGGAIQVSEVAAGVFIAAGAVCVGTAVARLLPHPAFAAAAAFATAFIQVRFFEVESWPWNQTQAAPGRFLGFLAETTSVEPALELRPSGWHLVYLAGLVVMMGCVALALDGLPRALGSVLAASIVVVGVSGWMQVRPPSEAQIERMVAYVEHPERRHVCDVRGTVRICAFENEPQKILEWRQTVDSVLTLLPPAVASRPLEVTARVPTVVGNGDCSPKPYSEGLPPGVAARIAAERVWAPDGKVHPGTDTFGCSSEGVDGLFLAVQTGAWAVGLPPAPHGRDVRCTADGEARSVLALWLGVAATPDGAAIFEEVVADNRGAHLDFLEWSDPPMWGVTFAMADVELAAAMARRPLADVRRVVSDNWSSLTAPKTSAATLAALVGIPGTRQITTKSATCP